MQPALDQIVDLVVHGGDLFFRSKVDQSIITKAFEPLTEIAGAGVPVYIVPGNHERSFIPGSLFDRHENLHIFDVPRSFIFQKDGKRLLLSGFPYFRGDIRNTFAQILDETKWKDFETDAKLLCLHHCFEGAKVGVQNYTFRNTKDVIKPCDIPSEFDAVLTGHIHRWQVLNERKSNGKTIPIIYSGSIERTSFSERLEEKGFLIIDLESTPNRNRITYDFVDLHARPMVDLVISKSEQKNGTIDSIFRERITKIDKNSIIRITIEDAIDLEVPPIDTLRKTAPETLNIDYRFPGDRFTKKI